MNFFSSKHKKPDLRLKIGHKSVIERILQLLHAYVAELHTLAVTAEADITLLVEQAGVVVTIHSVGVLLAAVGSYVVALTCLADVAVNDNLAINSNGDVVALDTNLL